MTISNTIALAGKFMPILDELYARDSVTARLDAQTKPVSFAGANVVEVMKTTTVGLGTYSRATGYPTASLTMSWETLTLAQSRGREFNIDRMDDEETLGMAFGKLASQFMKQQVAPEIDAYRFAKYAGTSNISTTTAATLSASTILAAIDAASAQLDEDSVPQAGRLLFISDTCNRFLRAAINRTLGNENVADRRLNTLDEMTIIPVPQSRFYTAVSLNAGASETAGGFAKTGTDVNFMLLDPNTVLQVQKLAQLKIFTPDENQKLDAWNLQYRIYHDAFVYDNMVDGIYLHKKAA